MTREPAGVVDLAIVGGGPAGLATALYATRAGMSVVVFEPRETPVDKACGEGLMPGAVDALAELGIHPAGYQLAGIRYLDDRRTATADFRGGHGLGVRRTTLHAAMRAAVDRAGVNVRQQRAGAVVQRHDRVVVGDVEARWLVGADGLHSSVRRGLGLGDRPRAFWPVRYGLRAHVTCRPWTDHVEVYWAPHSEAYVTPVADDLVGIAVLAGGRQARLPADEAGIAATAYATSLRAFPRLLERLGGHLPDATAVRGAGPLRQAVRRRVAGRVLLVGDAAGYVDALTGEGIALALGCARDLVQSLVDGEPESYEQRWRARTRHYRWLTGGLIAARGPLRLAGAIVPAAARLPKAFAASVDALARPARVD